MAFTYDVENFRNCFEHDFTWLNGFMRNVSRYGRQPAVRSGKTVLTYQELNEAANQVAHALLEAGAKKNDVLMFLLFNSIEFLLCYIAGHKIGMISAPVNYRIGYGELRLILEDSKPQFLVYDGWCAKTVQEALAEAQYVPPNIICVGDAPAPHTGFEEWIRGKPTGNPEPTEPAHIYDETLRLYTSGTTNLPKAVPINSINEVLSAHDTIMHYPLNPTDKTINLTPWFHRGGIHIGGPTATLYVGGEVVIAREFRPGPCLDLISDAGVTYTTGVPSIYALLARAQKSSPVDLSSLRGLCSMGSPFSSQEVLEYRELFTPNILNGYGTTETFVNTFMRPWSPLEKCSATGQSCIDDDVRVVRIYPDKRTEPDDMVAKDNLEVGEIIIKTPNKSTGTYVNNPEMSKRKFYRNFHYTGDIGTWDEDGYITVLSRKDDMIICSGENIYPAQIEAALNEHPDVAESAIIGVPDRLHGQVAVAYVVPLSSGLTEASLRKWCSSHPMLPPYKRPKKFRIVNELPHTATGKLKHYQLRNQETGHPSEH